MRTSADSGLTTAAAQPDFRELFESVPGLYLVLTPALRIVAATDSYLRATRTVREQIVGRFLFDVFPDNPDDPNASVVRNLTASLERVLQNNTPDTTPVQRYDIRRPESEGGGFEPRYWSAVNSPVAGKDGSVGYIIHRVEDVASQLETELPVRAPEQDRPNQDLRDANRELARGFANVSHEMRTPLTLLLSPVEELLKNPDAAVPVNRSDLELMRRNSLRLLRLVNTLVDLSNLEAGRLRGEYAPADLTELTADCASLFRSEVESAGLWFRLDLRPLGEAVYVDRSMWEKIVLNLLSNAFQFTPQGGITVTLRKVDNGAQLSVADTGIGIPEEELAHIFERSHRAKGSPGKSFEGTGTGLPLANEMVKLHGGTIGVQSVPNQGTTFTISFPFGTAHLPATQILSGRTGMTPAERAACAAEVEMWDIRREACLGSGTVVSETSPKASEGAGRPRILFADDNRDMRAYITRLLGEAYEVEAVSNGEQALAAINRRCPDLVLSDVTMPVMNGFQLLQALRNDLRTHTIPVVLLSARAQEDSRLEGLEAGPDDYLVKPFTARELRARVRSHLRLARMRKEVERRFSRLNSELEQRVQERTALLQASEELLKNFVKYVPAAVAMLDREMRYLQVSDRWCADFSRNSAEMMGRSHYEIFPGIPERWKEIHRRCLAGETLRADEDCWELPGGDQTWKRWEIRPWGDREGEPEGILIFSEDLTGRKRMEATLREGEATIHTLLETAAHGIVAVDLDGTVVMANRTAAKIFGYGAHELLGKPLEMLLPERLRTRHNSHRAEFAAHPRTRPMGIGIDLQGLRKDGTEFPIEVSLSSVGSGRGPAVAFVTDITIRKQAETALRNSEAQFRTLANAIPQLCWTANADGWTFWYNQRWYEYTGTTPEQMEGWGWQSVHDPGALPKVLERWTASIATGQPFDMVYPLRGADGVFRPFLTRVMPVLDGDGKVTRWFGTNTDISEQRKTEEALATSENRLRAYLASIVDSTDDAIVIMDLEGKVLSWNPGAERLFGYSAAEITGRKLAPLVVPPEGMEEASAILERTGRGEPVSFETERIRKDGQQVYVSLTVSPVRDAGGRVEGSCAIARDVTGRKRAEEQIRRFNAELERRVIERTAELQAANHELEAFAYSVSHDLRAPLRHVDGFLGLLEQKVGADADPATRHFMEIVVNASRTMGTLIDDLLAFSRMGRAEMRQTDVDMTALAESVAGELRGETAGRAVEVRMGALGRVPGDPALLRMVLQNLLSNAVKFTRHRAPAVIEIGREPADGWEAVFFVRDNGVGFDMRYVDKLFGVFQRLHSNEEFEGTGIGLANVHRIIRRHGGRVWAQGAVGQGATMYFSLPVLREDRETS